MYQLYVAIPSSIVPPLKRTHFGKVPAQHLSAWLAKSLFLNISFGNKISTKFAMLIFFATVFDVLVVAAINERIHFSIRHKWLHELHFRRWKWISDFQKNIKLREYYINTKFVEIWWIWGRQCTRFHISTYFSQFQILYSTYIISRSRVLETNSKAQ